MNRSKKLPLAVLVSGSGTNLQAIIDACEAGKIDAEIKLVISDTPKVKALERAKGHNIPAFTIEREGFDGKAPFEAEIVRRLNEHGVEIVCLAGFMRIIGNTLLAAFPNRIINIHPALLPSFPGLEAQRQAFDYGVKVSGATVHFVDEQTDHGPIICQTAVAVDEADTVDTLKARILEQEHIIYPRAIQLIAEGKVRMDGRRVVISDQ